MMGGHYIAKKKKIIRLFFIIFGPILIRLFGFTFSKNSKDKSKKIIKYMCPKKNEKILDCGCGIGYYSFEFNIYYKCEVVGIDLDEEDIMVANKIKRILNCANIEFYEIKIEELDNNILFDKILLSEVLEHIKNDHEILQKLSKLLKPNGLIVITVPYSSIPQEFDEQQLKLSNVLGGHVRSGYNVESFSKVLNKTNLILTKTDFYGNHKGLMLVLKQKNK